MNQTPIPDAHKTFNANVLMEQVMGDVDLFNEVLRVFQADLPIHFNQIRQGISTRETGLAYRAAHSLKGAARNVGASELAELAGEVEQRLQDELLDEQTATLIDATEQAIGRLYLQLESLNL